MRRTALLLAALLAGGATAHAQQPTVSRALQSMVRRDSVVAVWFFGAAGRSLDEVAAAVTQVQGRVRHRSRWLHAVSADIPSAAVALAGTRTEFRHLQPVARSLPPPPLPREAHRPGLAPPRAPADLDSLIALYGPSSMPLRRLGLFPLVERGYRGAGLTIAVLDTGFETEHAAFDSATVAAQWDFIFNDSIVRNEPFDDPGQSRHGTQVWSLLAATLPTQVIGVAPEATYLLAKVDTVGAEPRADEDRWVAALEWADSIGVDIVTSSLAYLDFDDGFSYAPEDLNGDVAVTTVAADAAVARGIVVVNAAGNRGPSFYTLATPADGDSVISVGAEDSLGVVQSFSSRGPTADRRLKPDLSAPGRAVYVVDPPPLGTGFLRVSGTSYSTPLIAGAVALFLELHPLLAPIQVQEALRRTGSNAAAPDSSRGWGRPDGAAAAYFPIGIVITAPADTALTSVTPTFDWLVPGFPGFALPLTYRLRLSSPLATPSLLLDTVVTESPVTITTPLRPGVRITYTVTGTAADGVRYMTLPSAEHVVPPWAELLTLDEPAGITIREPRPTFRWSSPDVIEPPGPFVYDLSVIRNDDDEIEIDERGLTATEYVPPADLERNTPYRWQITAHLGPDSAITESQGTFVIIDDSVPTVTLLFQNFPNPFPNRATGQQATCIWFDLAEGGEIRLDILDTRGHVVQTVIPSAAFPARLDAGRYGRPDVGQTGSCDPNLQWDGRAADGSTVPQGIYLIRLVTPEGTFFKRIVFMGAGF
ncbi:MAG: S8 family serine peptidase [Gemmatimonadota bacterium]|nr:MAG: S8 family serine peptidase [Gemmatimonadota bacterium]